MPALSHSKKGIGHRVRLDDLSLPITDENSGGDGLEDRFLPADMLSQLALGVTHLLSMCDIEANIDPFANMTVNSTHGRPTDQKKTIFASMLQMTLQFVRPPMRHCILPDGSDSLLSAGWNSSRKFFSFKLLFPGEDLSSRITPVELVIQSISPTASITERNRSPAASTSRWDTILSVDVTGAPVTNVSATLLT